MATPLVAPFPEFPMDAILRQGPVPEGGGGGGENVVAGENADADAASSSSIFNGKPTIILLNRRPGCILCRQTALRVSALAPKLRDLGVDLVCCCNAWLPAEIDAFVKDFWKPPLKVYLDVDKKLYAAVGENGAVRRGSLATFLNPFSRVWRAISEAKKTVSEHNLVGDGLTLGGVLAVSSKANKNKKKMENDGDGGRIEIVGGFQETTFGDAPSDEQILELARRAAEFAK